MRRYPLSFLFGLSALLGCSAPTHAALPVLPPPTVWNAAMPVVADGWIQVDISYALVRHRLMLCNGPLVDTPAGPECHQTGTTYTKPTFFHGGQLIPGPAQPFWTPQEYLDHEAALHPEWHQNLTFSALGLSTSDRGDTQVWLFYRVSDKP
jgi:hypothetical protein